MAPPPPPAGDTTAVVLDHVAVAVEHWADAWPRYVHQLGGNWHSGGVNSGFSPAQLAYANGAKVEVLQPWEPENNAFLRRFLDHSGPGPHHLTFKVPDIEAALERGAGRGIRAGERAAVRSPLARGVPPSPPGHRCRRPAGPGRVRVALPGSRRLPPSGTCRPLRSLHVTHAVRDLDTAPRALPRAARRGRHRPRPQPRRELGLRRPAPGPVPSACAWWPPSSDAGATTPLRNWLGDRPGRVHHLAFSVPEARRSRRRRCRSDGRPSGPVTSRAWCPARTRCRWSRPRTTGHRARSYTTSA